MRNLRHRSRQYTLLLLNEEGPITKLRFSRLGLRLVIVFLLIVFGLSATLVVDYVRDKFLIQRLTLAGAGDKSPALPATAAQGGEAEAAPAPTPRLLKVSELLQQVETRRAQLAAADRFFTPQRFDHLSLPDRWPLRGWVTNEFGRHRHPFTFVVEMHSGIDVSAPAGSEVRAPAGGTVLDTGEKPDCGIYLVLRHGHGLTSHYGHLSQILAATGQRVQSGEVIARSGNSGQSIGPHLHYEVRLHQVPINPRRYLPAEETPVASEAGGP